jgi:hypothetical protein
MWHKLSVVAAILVLLLARLVHGLWTDRWQTPQSMQEAVAKLDGLPGSLGPWQGEEQHLDASDVTGARLAGYRWRRYQNTLTGEVVSVLLVCGRPGPVSVHTPEVCYGGAGYDLVEKPVRATLSPYSLAQPAEFWTGRFRKSGSVTDPDLRIFWAWNARGTWVAARSPRVEFVRAPALYKLYVIAEEPATTAAQEKKPGLELLEQLLPALDKAL